MCGILEEDETDAVDGGGGVIADDDDDAIIKNILFSHLIYLVTYFILFHDVRYNELHLYSIQVLSEKRPII